MIAAVLLGVCAFASVMLFPRPPHGPSRSRRSLLGRWDNTSEINPILQSRIKPVGRRPDTEKESGAIIEYFILCAAHFISAG